MFLAEGADVFSTIFDSPLQPTRQEMSKSIDSKNLYMT